MTYTVQMKTHGPDETYFTFFAAGNEAGVVMRPLLKRHMWKSLFHMSCEDLNTWTSNNFTCDLDIFKSDWLFPHMKEHFNRNWHHSRRITYLHVWFFIYFFYAWLSTWWNETNTSLPKMWFYTMWCVCKDCGINVMRLCFVASEQTWASLAMLLMFSGWWCLPHGHFDLLKTKGDWLDQSPSTL